RADRLPLYRNGDLGIHILAGPNHRRGERADLHEQSAIDGVVDDEAPAMEHDALFPLDVDAPRDDPHATADGQLAGNGPRPDGDAALDVGVPGGKEAVLGHLEVAAQLDGAFSHM